MGVRGSPMEPSPGPSSRPSPGPYPKDMARGKALKKVCGHMAGVSSYRMAEWMALGIAVSGSSGQSQASETA